MPVGALPQDEVVHSLAKLGEAVRIAGFPDQLGVSGEDALVAPVETRAGVPVAVLPPMGDRSAVAALLPECPEPRAEVGKALGEVAHVHSRSR